jgi:hypothetical protein
MYPSLGKSIILPNMSYKKKISFVKKIAQNALAAWHGGYRSRFKT